MIEEGTREEIKRTLPGILTIRDVAEFLSVSPITVRRMIWDNQLPGYIADGEWNILRTDLITYLSRHGNL
ncbi:MAG TPA: helix-turn-helix domain-containing protein [Spirochaetia bacterium]|nr:helix-turn-helix domain-containing protein [Spirochaetia bacterium]